MGKLTQETYDKVKELYAPVFNFSGAEEHLSPDEIIGFLAESTDPEVAALRERIKNPPPNLYLVKTNENVLNPSDKGKGTFSNIQSTLNMGANETLKEFGAGLQAIGNYQKNQKLLEAGNALTQYGEEGKKSDLENLTTTWKTGATEQPLLKFGEKLGERPSIPGDTTVPLPQQPPPLFEQVLNAIGNISRSANAPEEPKTAVEKGLAREAAERGGDHDLTFNKNFFTPEALISQGLVNVIPQAAVMGGATALTKAAVPAIGKVLGDAIAAGVMDAAKAKKAAEYAAPSIGAATFGAGEGTQQAAASYNDIYAAVKKASHDDLKNSPLYSGFIDGGLSADEAKEKTARYVAEKGAKDSGAITALLGAPMGMFLGKLFAGGKGGGIKIGNPLVEIPLGAGGEAAQEFAQGIGQSLAETKAKTSAGVPAPNPSLEAANNAVQGAALGGLMGGGLTGITHLSEALQNKQQEKQIKPPNEKDNQILPEPPETPAKPPESTPIGVLAGNLPPVPEGYEFNPQIKIPSSDGITRQSLGYVNNDTGVKILIASVKDGVSFIAVDTDWALIGGKSFGSIDSALRAVSVWEEARKPKPPSAVVPPAPEPAPKPEPIPESPPEPVATARPATPEPVSGTIPKTGEKINIESLPPPIVEEPDRGTAPQPIPATGSPLQPPVESSGVGSSPKPPKQLKPPPKGTKITIDALPPVAGEDDVQYAKEPQPAIAPLKGEIENTGEKFILTMTGIGVKGNPAGRSIRKEFAAFEDAVKFAQAVAAKEKKLRAAGEFAPLPADYAPPVPPSETVQRPAEKPPQSGDFAERFYLSLKNGTAPRDIRGMRVMLGESLGIPAGNLTAQHLKIGEEDIEYALTKHARDIVKQGGTAEETYQKLVDLYNNQPNMLHRTSTSIANQAYSTPLPLAWIATKLSGITQNSTVYEPTAGNGALLIGVSNPKNALAAEIDQTRIKNLQKIGINVKNIDTTQYNPHEKVDAVLANPPFGELKSPVDVNGYKISKIDHLIAAKALSAMKDDGRAVLILGAQRDAGSPFPASDRTFFNWLSSHYHVAGLFDVAGNLYRRQGASWPVRVVVVNGRKTAPDKTLAPAPPRTHLNTWREIYEKAEQIMDSLVSPIRTGGIERGEVANAPVRGENPGGQTPAQEPGRGAVVGEGNAVNIDEGNGVRGEPGGVVGGGNIPIQHGSDYGGEPGRPGGGGGELGTVPGANVGGGLGQPPGETVPGGRSDGEGIPGRVESVYPAGSPSAGTGRNDVGLTKPPEPVKTEPEALLSPYVNVQSAGTSSGDNPEVLIPANQVVPLADNLRRLVEKYGSLDEFVRSELGYPSIEALHQALFGIQVDAVAAAIDNAKEGYGMIIADETGLGKGRQAAAMIRWAKRQGYTPVFFTVSANLFSDIYRDLEGIGEPVAPFFFNGGGELFKGVYGSNGEVAIPPIPNRERLRVLNLLAEGGALPQPYTVIFSTYTQISQPGNLQRRALAAVSDGGRAFFILDEAHKAGGAGSGGGSNTFNAMQNALRTAAGVVYLSATYSKRPDTMPIYFRTKIIDAFRRDIAQMVSTLSSGGLPLLRIVSAALAKVGQLIRRETDFSGIEVSVKTPDYETEEGVKSKLRQTELSDLATGNLRGIIRFNSYFVWVEAPIIIERLVASGEFGTKKKEIDLHGMNFASQVHNFTKQLLFGFKARAVVQLIKDSLANGEKVFVSFENTMESFLDNYIAEHKIVPGQKIPGFGWSSILRQGLHSSMRITGHDRYGNDFRLNVKRDDLTPQGQEKYDRLIDEIDASADDLTEIPVLPIDYITSRLIADGIRVGEITGRHSKATYENGVPVLSTRTKEETNKIKTVYAFNNGEIDVILANDSGSTGISLHASKTFKDQRKRRMIIAQPNGDINVFMQIKGRVNRVGQVVLPAYTLASTGLPSETRPLAILSGKLKKLNANTSANSRSMFGISVPDILNLYGDYVVKDWMEEHPQEVLDIGLNGDENANDLAAIVTGRLATLPVAKQIAFWDEIIPAYTEYVDYLTQIGANELDSDFLDLDAKKVSENHEVYKGSEQSSPFTSDANAAVYDIRKLGAKYTADDVKKEVDAELAKFNVKTGYDFDTRLRTFAEIAKQNLSANLQRESNLSPGELKSKIEDIHEEMNDFLEAMTRFWPGVGFNFDFDGTQQTGVVVGIKNPQLFEGKPGNPFAPSATRITFIINGGVGRITIPLSKIKADSSPVLNFIPKPSIDGIFHESGHVLRERRYIVTGNLTSAIGELLVKGRIVDFTDSGGHRLQGILMPKRFDPRTHIRNEIEFLRPEDIINFIQRNPNGVIMERNRAELSKDGLTITAGFVHQFGAPPRIDSLFISIPGSKKEGERWFGNDALRRLGVVFAGDRKRMSAYLMINGEKIKPALTEILRLTKLYAEGPPSAPKGTSQPTTPGATQSGVGDSQEGPPLHENNMNYLRGKENLNYKLEGVLNVRDAVSKSTILAFIKKAFGIDVRQFATHAPSKNVLGFFSPRKNVTRVRVWGALETTAHEVAHALDHFLKKAINPQWKSGSKEMTRNERVILHKELGELDYDSERKNTAEGFAEYMRVWLSFGDEEAKKIAPHFHDYFMDNVVKIRIPEKINPALRGRSMEAPLLQLERYYRKWYQQGALNRVISQIDVSNNTAPESERGIINAARRAWKNIYTFFALEYNDAHGLELLRDEVQKTIGRPLKPSEDPLVRYTVERLSVNKIAETLIHGNFAIDPLGKPLDGDGGRPLVKSLRSVLLPLTYEEMTPFIVYGVMRRAADLHDRELVSGFEDADIKYLLSDDGKRQLGYRPEWDSVYRDFTTWSDNLLDWAIWGHVITEETKKIIKDLNPLWLPFKRIIDDASSSLNAPGGGLKYFYGSGRPIMNPLESVQKVVVSLLTKSIRGRLYNTLAELAGHAGIGQFIVEIPLPLQSVKFELGQIKKQLEDLGIEPEKLAELDESALMTLFWRGPTFMKKPNTFMILREGKYRMYEVDADIFKALEEMMWIEPSGKFNRMIYNGFSFFVQMVKIGATGMSLPFNLIKNPLRDFALFPITAEGANTPTPVDPIAGTIQAIIHNRRGVTESFESEALHRYSLGASTSMQFAGTAYRIAAQNLLWRKAGLTQKIKLTAANPVDMTWYFLKNFLYQVQDKLQIFELGPRMTELQQMMLRARRENGRAVEEAEKAGKSKKEIDEIRWSDEDFIIHAVAAAKDVTINFSKTGRYGKYLNPIIPFYTASIQGPNKAFRALKKNPVRFIFRSIVWLTLPSIFLWAINKDKDWYKRMFPELRAMSNFIENSDGNIFPMPLPFELSIFGSLPVAILNYFYNHDADAVRGALRQWLRTLMPNYRVAAIWPFIDVESNTSWFDRPIEPDYMRSGSSAVPIEDRVYPWTTDFAKGLSAFFLKLGIRYSPIQWDYLLRNYTGSFANQIMAFDKMFFGPDIGNTGKNFFTTYLRNPDRPNRELAMFFGERSLLQQQHNVKKITAEEEGRLREMNAFYNAALHPLMKAQRELYSVKTEDAFQRIIKIDKEMGRLLDLFYDPKNRGAYPFAGGQEALVRGGSLR